MRRTKVLYQSEERTVTAIVDEYSGIVELHESLDGEEPMVVTVTNSELMAAALEIMQQQQQPLPFADPAILLN